MAKYLIHAVPKRMWYVNEYLVPSMFEQGISHEDVKVYCDDDHEGNLKACMNAFELCKGDGGTWHLQDDVIISRRFAEQTEIHDNGIVCAFHSKYDAELQGGIVPSKQMWFSFPCIRIPDNIAQGCAKWVKQYIIGNSVYKEWWDKGVNDDMLFRQYVWSHHPHLMALNLEPNLVDHVDYLIGGTVNSNSRKLTQIRSLNWEDEDLVSALSRKLMVK